MEPPSQQPNNSYEDPFAGQIRLNSLSERDYYLMNPHMSNPDLLRRYHNMSDDELNDKSREYYLSLTTARINHQQQLEAQNLDKTAPRLDTTTSIVTNPTSSDTTTTTTTHELPYGWNERLNITSSITEIQPDSAPQQSRFITKELEEQEKQARIDKENKKTEILQLMNDAIAESKKITSEISQLVKELKEAKAKGDQFEIDLAMDQYKLKREQLQHAQAKENSIMAMMSGQF
jgi:hypothetical protein